MKFKKPIVALYIFFITTPIQAVNLNSEGSGHPLIVYTPPISYNSWGKDFYKFLIDSESVEMQTVGLALYYANYHEEYNQITNYLNQLLPKKLNKESLYILRNVCHKLNKYKSTCEKHGYYNRLIKNDPQNLNLYIEGLFQYEKSNNSQLINKIIDQVKECTHISSYNGYFMKGLKVELTNYFSINPNPLDQAHPLFENNNIILSPNEKNETIANNLVYLFNQRFHIRPYYHYFLGHCDNKLTKDEIKSCDHVIDILINKSDSKTHKSVGFNSQANNELANHDYRTFDYDKSNYSIIAHSKIRLTSICESNPSKTSQSKDRYRNYKKVHPLYLRTVIENTQKSGLAKAKKLGYLALANYLITKNLLAPESFENCEEINKLTAVELYAKFKENSQVAYILKKYRESR